MFNRHRLVIMAVYVLFAAEVAAMCTVLAIAVPQIEFTSGCLITSTPKLFPSYWSGHYPHFKGYALVHVLTMPSCILGPSL